jgi:hypothetical protein
MTEIKINNTNELKNYGYSDSAIELIKYCVDWYDDYKDYHNSILVNIDIRYWLLAYHIYINYLVRDKEGLDVYGKEHELGLHNVENSSETLEREILRDFVLKILEQEGKKEPYTKITPNDDYEFKHLWLDNEKIFSIMRAVAEYDLSKQLDKNNLVLSLKKPDRYETGFELYIKVGSWELFNDCETIGALTHFNREEQAR